MQMIKVLQFIIIEMELDYPTLKNQKFTQQINQLDKLGRSILLSLRDIPSSDGINKRIKQKLLKAISKDDSYQLHLIIEKEVIRFDVTVGSCGSKWNMLHFCSKSDAVKCIGYILQKQYQEFSEQYEKLVNSRTVQGYTPIVTAIINRSNKALQKLLYFGGVDLHLADYHKMSPYEIALNYKNDTAIRLLMNYQALTKKKQYINREALHEPIYFPNKKKYLKAYMDAVLCCLTLGFFNFQSEQINQKNGEKFSFITTNQSFIDYVHIGSKKELPGYQIDWLRASQLALGHKIPLYDSFNPFEIRQPNFTIKNHLMIFQCLSQQPWLIRKTIKTDKNKLNNYQITLYPKKVCKYIYIDEHIPYLKQRKQAMFLSDSSELWPMLIQKALAKQHEAYFALNNFQPGYVLEEITGFPTKQIKISSLGDQKILEFLQKISAKNYLLLLKGKKNSGLNQSENSVDCFTILNYYEKVSGNLVLVNCPFILQKWKLKQKNQSLDLKLIKGHYNSHNQMCVWIEEENLKKYFQSIIVSLTFPSYQRTEIKFRGSKIIFFRLRIQATKIDEPTVFYLMNQTSGQVCDLSGLQIMKNEGQQQISCSSPCGGFFSQLAQIQTKAGQYMCYIQVNGQQKQIQDYQLICYSVDCLQPQYIQQQFAILQWFGYIKTYFPKIQQKCVVQTVGNYSIVLLKQKNLDTIKFRCQTTQQNLIQGKYIDAVTIELIKQEDIHYCVLKQAVSQEQVLFDYQ